MQLWHVHDTRWGDDLSGRVKWVLIRGRQEGQNQRENVIMRAAVGEERDLEDAPWLALKMEEGAFSQGRQAASRSWEGHRRKLILPASLQEARSLADTLILSL